MKAILLKSYYLIPKKKRQKLPLFIGYSLFNTVLDFISIVYLVPIILIFLDKYKLKSLTTTYLNIELNNNIVLILLGSLIMFYVLKNLIQTKIIKIQSKYIYSISTEISDRLMNKFIYENYNYYNTADKNIFFRDVFQLPMTFATNILFSFYNLFSESIIILFVVVIGLIYNPLVTVFSFSVLLTFVFIILKVQKKKVAVFNDTIVNLYQENLKNVMNIFYGFVEIKTSKSEEKFKERFNTSNVSNNNQLALLIAFKQSNAKYLEILLIIGLSFALLFYVFINNTNDLVLLAFFAGSSIKIIPSFNKILNAVLDIKANRKVVEILHNYEEFHTKEHKKIEFSDHLKLNNIDFDYHHKNILRDINLEINKCDFISISGSSGQGKSTLLLILSGLLSPKNGTITVDFSLADSNQNLFSFVGYVPQQPFLFQGTILENITMLNNNNIDYDFIYEILTSLDLMQWIKNLPNGLHTDLLLESKKLSGGQKQRIALARALYYRPKILLLDEATNQLDERLELKVFNYLHDLVIKKELTIVAISHGIKVHQFANKKYNLENGYLTQNE